MSKGGVIFGGVILAGVYVAYKGRSAPAQPEPQIMPAVDRTTGNTVARYAPLIEWGLQNVNFFGSKNTTTTTAPGAGQFSLESLWQTFTGSTPQATPAQGVAQVTPARADIGIGGIDFAAKERQYGLPRGYLRRTAEIESAMDPRAQNPNSSAGGLFQFINATAADYGLTDRFNPVAATDAAARLARDNKARLRPVLGRDPTGGELYLAHQQGGGGAAKLLRNRSALAVNVVGSAAVRLNGGGPNMTAGQFADLWINKFNRVA